MMKNFQKIFPVRIFGSILLPGLCWAINVFSAHSQITVDEPLQGQGVMHGESELIHGLWTGDYGEMPDSQDIEYHQGYFGQIIIKRG